MGAVAPHGGQENTACDRVLVRREAMATSATTGLPNANI
jgi:hypothetical protein